MTKIEWTDQTWNPIRARNKETGGVGHFCAHVSDGCKHCYAERMQRRFRNPVRYAVQDLAKVEPFIDDDILWKPAGWRKPRMVFVCSMTDLFAEWHDDDWISDVFEIMRMCSEHTFQVLTKRPERMRDLVPREPLPNVWLGVSIESRREEARAWHLGETPAAVRFWSLEPLLAGLGDLTTLGLRDTTFNNERGVHWVIVGGESGAGARPFLVEWAYDIVAQCKSAGVAVFVKQLGANVVGPHANGINLTTWNLRDSKGGDMAEWPEPLRVREFPAVTRAEAV